MTSHAATAKTEAAAQDTLSSMTGFASGQGTLGAWTWSMDVRSVNGRGLDIRCRMPDWIEGLEPEMRKLFQGRIQRGSVTVNVRVQQDDAQGGLRVDAEALSHAMSVLREIEHAADQAGLSLDPVKASDIASFRGVLNQSDVRVEDTAALKAAILGTAAVCIDAFAADRDREGRAVADVISAQIDRVETLVAEAEAAAGDREAASREAMQRAVSRLLDVTDVPDEARLVQELALIAVKNDVTEEIDRLGAHVAAARDLLIQKGAVGRKFDFLMQEFNREANTLCSKSQSTALTAVGLDLKALIDQMREQVQNIE